MSQRIPIYIPTYINSAEYTPARVLPRLFFYNGLIDCETYWIESGSAAFGGVTFEQNAFPYFDNYNVVSGSFPTIDSDSLLFTNENASYGEIPTGSLYTTYWDTYISLLYNPKTRLVNCSAIIPLADYFKMELNDIVNFKGNYYHLRAINDYSLKTGECNLQLLGPIISDTFSAQWNGAPSGSRTTTTTTTTIGPSTTTTLAPTTTTTTFSNNPCNCVEINLTSEGGEVATFNCYGQNENYVYSTSGTKYLCAAVIGGLLQVSIVSGTGTYSPIGNCKTGACPPATTTTTTSGSTTTTSTSTTTTTTTSTTTTTTAAPMVIFTAANCQDIYDNNTYQALSSSAYTTGSVFIDASGTCYYILNFTGEVPVGTLTYLATGSCGAAPCITTTTTASPFCNIWNVSNATGAGYYFKYKYCGATTYSYPEVAPFSSMSVCVQNNEIFNAFAAPLTFTNTSSSCIATTTTTTTTIAPTTTTTTTRAPYCSPWTASNAFNAAYDIQYTYCGATGSTIVEVPANSSIYLCVQSGQINNLGNPILLTEDSGSCVATTTTTSTTTTTTLAPGCFIYDVTNNGVGTGFVNYVYCGNGSTYQQFSLAGGASGSICVDNNQINDGGNLQMVWTRTTASCAATTTTTTSTTTTTTTTLPPFSNPWTADAWFDTSGFSYEVEYTNTNNSLTSSIIS